MSEQTIKKSGSYDFLTGKIKPMYFKYLTAAFGSALISSIYGVVDMAMVGQYQGPNGTAALAVVSPVWNIIYSLGLLMGIGGSVLFSTLRGESEQNLKKSNEYFTASLIGVAILALITWIAVIFFDRNLLTHSFFQPKEHSPTRKTGKAVLYAEIYLCDRVFHFLH